jgi:hypothetical protein
LIHIRKGTKWNHNGIRTNQADLALLDSKAANESKMAINRNANANSASGRSKAAANKVAVSKADDKFGCLGLMNGGLSCLEATAPSARLQKDAAQSGHILSHFPAEP